MITQLILAKYLNAYVTEALVLNLSKYKESMYFMVELCYLWVNYFIVVKKMDSF